MMAENIQNSTNNFETTYNTENSYKNSSISSGIPLEQVHNLTSEISNLGETLKQ